jgi:hypothetical protein
MEKSMTNKHSDIRDLLCDTQGESSVNINNITNNTKQRHLTYNTTLAPKGANKVVAIETSSPLASASQRNRDLLERQVIENRNAREKAKDFKNREFREEMAERRKKMQFAKERDAKYLVANAKDVFRIEASVYTKHNRINIDICQSAGDRFAKYVVDLETKRARNITANVSPKHKDWFGYVEAKQAVADGKPAGKMRLRQNSGSAVRIAPKTLPCTAVIMDARELTIIIGDHRFELYLEDIHNEWYCAKGIYQQSAGEIEL